MPNSKNDYDCARRAAKRVGLAACRSNFRRNSINNHGGFQIYDPLRNLVIQGDRYELTAAQVIEFCADYSA